ncbi:MAG TPA: hypothetical protein VIJ34_13170, partial [Acidimicrobiales bacterium]
QEAVLKGFDLAARHLRVIARRIHFLLKGDLSRPELIALLSEVATAIDLLGTGIEDPSKRADAAVALRQLAPRLEPATLMPHAPVRESILVLLVRPLVVDLLVATGSSADEARALLPTL